MLQERTNDESEKRWRGKREVTDFVLYHDKKSFGAGPKRVSATVIHIQCKREDSTDLKDMVMQYAKVMPAPFVPVGYHLSESPARMLEMLNGHNKWVNKRRIIDVVGLTEEMMESRMYDASEQCTVKEYIRDILKLDQVERTSRTNDLGKWVLITDSEVLEKTRGDPDEVLGQLSEKYGDKSSEMLGKIGRPRRTNRSIAAQCLRLKTSLKLLLFMPLISLIGFSHSIISSVGSTLFILSTT